MEKFANLTTKIMSQSQLDDKLWPKTEKISFWHLKKIILGAEFLKTVRLYVFVVYRTDKIPFLEEGSLTLRNISSFLMGN